MSTSLAIDVGVVDVPLPTPEMIKQRVQVLKTEMELRATTAADVERAKALEKQENKLAVLVEKGTYRELVTYIYNLSYLDPVPHLLNKRNPTDTWTHRSLGEILTRRKGDDVVDVMNLFMELGIPLQHASRCMRQGSPEYLVACWRQDLMDREGLYDTQDCKLGNIKVPFLHCMIAWRRGDVLTAFKKAGIHLNEENTNSKILYAMGLAKKLGWAREFKKCWIDVK